MKIGDIVKIYNGVDSSGNPRFEGRAKIRKAVNKENNRFLVEFENEKGQTYQRFVDESLQK